MSVQAESLGPVFNNMDGYETSGHISPLRARRPSTSMPTPSWDGLVNALYAVYEEKAKPGFEGQVFRQC